MRHKIGTGYTLDWTMNLQNALAQGPTSFVHGTHEMP